MDKNKIVISSRVRFARNLKDINFPSRLSLEDRKKVVDNVTSSILESNSYISKEFNLVNLNTLKDYEKASLVEKHLISKELINSQEGAALINSSETISIMINEEDHIRLQVIEKGLNIEKCFDIANKIDDLMEEKLTYAFDPKFGYLTSCITNIGCAARVSVMMHLPALTKSNKIPTLSKELSRLSMTIRGIYGEGSEGLSNMYQVSNQGSLGTFEENIIKNISEVVKSIIKSEIKERESLLYKDKEELEDIIYRSFGILKYTKKISTKYALNLLSNVRLGVEMGMIDNISFEKIQEITENIQSGNIQRIFSKNMTPRERDIERAKMLNKLLV